MKLPAPRPHLHRARQQRRPDARATTCTTATRPRRRSRRSSCASSLPDAAGPCRGSCLAVLRRGRSTSGPTSSSRRSSAARSPGRPRCRCSACSRLDPSAALSKSLVIGVAGLWLGPGILGRRGRAGVRAAASSSAPIGPAGVREQQRHHVQRQPDRHGCRSASRANRCARMSSAAWGCCTPASPIVLAIEAVDRNLLALNLGGGAIGILSERVGVRFDLRHTRACGTTRRPRTPQSRVRLSYWRATVGVTLRY